MKEKLQWFLAVLFVGILFSIWFAKNNPVLPSVIATTERIMEAENIIEWQNKQNLNQAKIIKNQKVFAQRAIVIINRAVKFDSLSAAKAKEWGWLEKRINK